MKFYKNDLIKNKDISSSNKRKKLILWMIRISFLAFFLSLLLSLFSEIVLEKTNIFVAILLLSIFLSLNVFSDMLGLAITSCQINLLNRVADRKDIYNMSICLIKNSDKVSSILCDVVGDVSGILCGVSGTMISIALSIKFGFTSLNICLGAFVSSFIAALTVLLKALAKKFAINNSVSIVKFTAKILLKVNKFICKLFKRKI